MSEKERKTFTNKELTELLVKHAGVHEGHWGLLVEFGFGASNIPVAGPDGDFSIKPAAFVSVNNIGLQRFDSPTPLTVDAAKVNPATASSSSREKRRKPQEVQ